ncbi:MAG: DUF2339 domain-containing protein [Nanoarchaeota archaeon]
MDTKTLKEGYLVPTKNNWQQYFNKLNKTVQNFELRIEKLEKQIAVLSKKTPAQIQETQQELVFESPPKRRLGWGLIWIGIILLMAPWLGFRFLSAILPYGLSSLLTLGLIITGIVLILTNPKIGTSVSKAAKKELVEEEAETEEEIKITKKTTAKAEAAKKVPTEKEKSDLESDIGKKWLPKIGVISIVLGVAFFVIYAIQNKWIGPTGQVALGVLAGIVLVIAGEIFERKGYYNYAMTLVGGGFAIMYFAMFAAYRFYNLLPLIADVISISIIIMAAIYFSVRYNSIIIASEAFFLGYFVPLLTSSVNTFFLIYAIALTVGLIALTYFRNWKVLGALGMVAMYVTHIFWLDNYTGDNQSTLHIIFLFIYFIMFAAMALKIKETDTKEIDSWLNQKFLFAALFIITYLFVFQVDFRNVFYVIPPLILLLLLSAFFILRFDWDYFVIGGIVLTYVVHWRWLGLNFNESSIFVNFVGLSIYFVLFNILLFLLKDQKNKASNVGGILINSAFYYGLNAWVGFHFDTGLKGLFTAMLSVFYLVFAYLAYQRKVSHYFNTFIILCFGYLTLTIPLQFNQEWITISWSVLTLILVMLSFRLKENSIRISSSIVGGITLFRVLFFDSWKLNPFNLSNILSSTRFFAFLSVIIIFYVIAYLYYKNKDDFVDYSQYIRYINATYAIAATLLVAVIIWLEIWDTKMALNAKKLWTSLAFILQAIIVLSFGFSAKIKLFRIMGLLLFGLSILKVFLYDLSNLETGYRIISFIVLGIIALLGAFLYNKYKEYI